MTTPYIAIHSTHRHRDAGANRLNQFKFGILAAAAACLLAYLWQVNAVSSKGFQIKSLEKQINGLKIELQQMELSLASEQAINKINGRVANLNMVKVDKVEYIRPLGNSVALGR